MHNLLCSMSAELAVSSLPLEVWMIYWSCHSCILLSHSCCLLSGIAPPILCWSVLSVSLQNICAALRGQRMPAAIWLDLNPSNVCLVCIDLYANFAAV